MDYEKVFDKVDRSMLWHKLIAEKVSTKLVKALSSMYTVVKSCIRYQSLRSRFFSSHIGLKQGDPSSPLMFMMFINDIAQNMNANFDDIFTTNELRLLSCCMQTMQLYSICKVTKSFTVTVTRFRNLLFKMGPKDKYCKN